jgi:hypothetical protein
MKVFIIFVLLLGLQVSCEKKALQQREALQKGEWGEIDDGVYQITDSVSRGKTALLNYSFTCTLYEDDNKAYFIINWQPTSETEAFERILMEDAHGNILYQIKNLQTLHEKGLGNENFKKLGYPEIPSTINVTSAWQQGIYYRIKGTDSEITKSILERTKTIRPIVRVNPNSTPPPISPRAQRFLQLQKQLQTHDAKRSNPSTHVTQSPEGGYQTPGEGSK